MSYFIFDQSKNVDVFANTRVIERIAGQPRVCGNAYHDTKNFLPSTIAMIFKRDIHQAISDDKLPQILFEIKVERQSPTPLYRIEIHHIAEPIVLRVAHSSEPEINCENSSLGRIQLTELAHYVRAKIMQIMWKYNADLITTKGIYGHTHFIYQIAISPDLIERQIKSFDIERGRIAKRERENAASSNVA